MEYRATPLANGHSPSELLMGRKLRTTVPAIPSTLDPGRIDFHKLRVVEKARRAEQSRHFNLRHRAHTLPQLQPGEHVWIQDTKEKGTVLAHAETPRSYLVDTPRGILRRNRSHLVPTPVPPTGTGPLLGPEHVPPVFTQEEHIQAQAPATSPCPEPDKLYPKRERLPPKYLRDYVCS